MWFLALTACLGPDPSIPTAEATRGTFEVRLAVHGELDAKNSEQIVTPDFDGRPEIGWIIEEGSQVAKGDKLIEFDTADMEKRLETAETGLKLARTKISQETAKLRLKLADANASIKKAELDLELARMRRTDSDTVPLVEREQAKVSETKSAMAIDAARAQLETVQLESEAETQLQQLDLDRNLREVEELREDLEQAVLVAPTDGIALLETKWDDTAWAVGGRPWTGATLIKLPELNTMEVVGYVHEVDTPQIEKDQTAVVTMDAHPDAPVDGTIDKVADLAVARGEDEVKYLEIKLALAESRPEMKPGMTVRVDLLLATHPDVVTIPIESVVRGEEAGTYVYVASLSGWSRTDVELGAENDTHVIVTSGLEEGAKVALVNPETWEKGSARPVAQVEDP